LKHNQSIWDFNSFITEEKPTLIEGRAIVTRNPCTHPGDIRLLKAVYKEELSHLFNVVVFSSKGSRPQCNKMAGGDLDGDIYFVCWDQTLTSCLSEDKLIPPAMYTKPTFISEKPDSDNIADYFIFYLEKDVLGKLANMHLALCDQIG
jgi:RNA-dependent RNA polymerase